MCYTVFYLGSADILDFNRILHCLEEHLRVRTLCLLHFFWNAAVERVIQFRRIDQYDLFPSKMPDIFINVVIRIYRNAVFCKACLNLLTQLRFIYIKLHMILRDDKIRQYKREEFNIIAADVQSPADIIQGSKHMRRGAAFFHNLADPSKLTLCRLSGILDI